MARATGARQLGDSKRGDDFNPENLSKPVADSLHREDLKYIKTKLFSLFDEANFERNPLKDNSYNLIEESDYKDMLGDTTLIGFSYRIGSVEGFETIAYSKKQRKVKMIFATD